MRSPKNALKKETENRSSARRFTPRRSRYQKRVFILILGVLPVVLAFNSSADTTRSGLEIRLRDLVFEAPLMPKASQIPVPQIAKFVSGSVKKPQLFFQISGWGFEHNFLVLKGLQLSFRATEWSFKKSSVLELRCKQPRAQWNIQKLSLSPDRLKDFQFFINPDGTLAIDGDFEREFRELLLPYFQESALRQTLFLKADCPANAASILQGFLRAWLVNYPTKRPESFKELSNLVRKELGSLSLGKVKVSRLIQNSLALLQKGAKKHRLELKVRRSVDPKVLRWIPKLGEFSLNVEENLSPPARALLQTGAPKTGVEILGDIKILDSIVQTVLSYSSLFGNSSESAAPAIDLKAPLELDSLASVLPELSPYRGKNLKLFPRIVLEDCRQRVRFPQLIPFVGLDGRSYLDVVWFANLELFEQHNSKALVKRTLSPFWLRTQLSSDLGETLNVTFKGGGLYRDELRERRDPLVCDVKKGPPEFELTLDWILSSHALEKAVQEVFRSSQIPRSETGGIRRLRYLGFESEERRYGDSGFLAEAWVMQVF